ncbi:hypothetical protein JXQ31_07345 [candidate division KSB1 bacterium]|nr:hypothetical protein [candidate division KSB1 bacterium]
MRRSFVYILLVFKIVTVNQSSGQTVEQNYVSQARPSVKPKHTAIAMSLGVVNWIVPPVLSYKLRDQGKNRLADWLLYYGVIAGPSMGNYYAGDKKRFYIGSGIRVAVCLAYLIYTNDYNEKNAAWGVWGVLTGSSLWSIWSSRGSVREYNARINTVSLIPIINPGNKSLGFAAVMRF